MTYGKWSEIFHAYREIYNFEAGRNLYPDIEKEIKQYREAHQPVASLLSL